MGNENGKIDYIPKLPSKLNLLQSAHAYFDFIQKLSFNPHLFHPKVVQYAIYRYQAYWLPFAAKHSNQILAAPVDIELIWVVHILNRESYKRDCLQISSKCCTNLFFFYLDIHHKERNCRFRTVDVIPKLLSSILSIIR